MNQYVWRASLIIIKVCSLIILSIFMHNWTLNFQTHTPKNRVPESPKGNPSVSAESQGVFGEGKCKHMDLLHYSQKSTGSVQPTDMSRKQAIYVNIYIKIYVFKQQQPLQTILPNSTVSSCQALHLAAGGTIFLILHPAIKNRNCPSFSIVLFSLSPRWTKILNYTKCNRKSWKGFFIS